MNYHNMDTSFSIHFIMTGGTIDSFYDGSKDTVVTHKESVIPQFIESLKLYHPSEYTTICMKDSRELVREDINEVLKTVESSSHTHIIITHGTYTVPDSARFIQANLQRKDQVVILTGSAIPLTGLSPSDAPFNLGFAVAKLEDLAPGVYVAFNGRIFQANEVMKILNDARFVSIFNT